MEYRPLPLGSHANPTRGAQFLAPVLTRLLGLYPTALPHTTGKMKFPLEFVSLETTDGKKYPVGSCPLLQATTKPPPGRFGSNIESLFFTSLGLGEYS